MCLQNTGPLARDVPQPDESSAPLPDAQHRYGPPVPAVLPVQPVQAVQVHRQREISGHIGCV